jgi:hypothetical protein
MKQGKHKTENIKLQNDFEPKEYRSKRNAADSTKSSNGGYGDSVKPTNTNVNLMTILLLTNKDKNWEQQMLR